MYLPRVVRVDRMIISLGIAISLHKIAIHKYLWVQPYDDNLEAHIFNIRLVKGLKFIRYPWFFNTFIGLT